MKVSDVLESKGFMGLNAYDYFTGDNGGHEKAFCLLL